MLGFNLFSEEKVMLFFFWVMILIIMLVGIDCFLIVCKCWRKWILDWVLVIIKRWEFNGWFLVVFWMILVLIGVLILIFLGMYKKILVFKKVKCVVVILFFFGLIIWFIKKCLIKWGWIWVVEKILVKIIFCWCSFFGSWILVVVWLIWIIWIIFGLELSNFLVRCGLEFLKVSGWLFNSG